MMVGFMKVAHETARAPAVKSNPARSGRLSGTVGATAARAWVRPGSGWPGENLPPSFRELQPRPELPLRPLLMTPKHPARIRILFLSALATATGMIAWSASHRPSGEAGPPKAPTPLPQAGRRDTIRGVAEDRKDGAVIRGEDRCVFVVGMHRWPRGVPGREVTAEGILGEDHGLAVIRDEDRMFLQGVPVPAGTDMREASRRQTLSDITWSLAEKPDSPARRTGANPSK